MTSGGTGPAPIFITDTAINFSHGLLLVCVCIYVFVTDMCICVYVYTHTHRAPTGSVLPLGYKHSIILHIFKVLI